MRILLIQPDCQTSRIGFRFVAMPEPLALEMVAAAVPDHDVRILDMRIDSDLSAQLEAFSPDVVGVTALTTEVYAAQDLLRAVKAFSPQIFTVVGGHHATLLHQDFAIPQVDAIALGEGEVVFPGLVEALAAGSDRRKLQDVPNLIWQDDDGRFNRNALSPATLSMDVLPLPRRDLTERYRDQYYFLFDRPDAALATSRGCPFRCNFCSVWVFSKGKTRQMSARRVVEEIASVDTDHITFVDDNFLMNQKREHAIADLIRASGLRKRYSMECRTDSIVRHPELVAKWADIGLYAVLLGLEGASDNILKTVNKRNTAKTNDEAIRILQDHGIIIWGAFMADPDWDEDAFIELRDYVSARQITHTQFTVLTPLPGTELYRERRDELLTDDYTCYDTLHAVLPTRLPREDFYKRFANLYRQRDLSPYYDLVREGKLTIDDCRRGKQMLDALSQWELYLENDPVLGKNGGPREPTAQAEPPKRGGFPMVDA
jgi:radical SAM superfamily enzyme YgiQ (UPF0313 family)